MDTQILESIRRKLITRGRSLIAQQTQAEPQTSDPAKDHPYPPRASVPALESNTARRIGVRAAEAAALIRIQACLARIAQGTFGDCVVCHGAIETERLRAFPEVDRCGGCTH